MSGEDADATLQGLVDGLCSIDFDSAVTVVTSVLQARPELAPPVINFAVPDLTYPPSKALIDRRAEGWVKSFNDGKGFGFIECEELHDTFGADVFLHHSQLGGFQTGSAVSFAVMLSKDSRPQAYDLQPIDAKGGGGKGMSKAGSGKGDGGWGSKGDAAWYGKGGWGKGDGGWGMGDGGWGGKGDGGWGSGGGKGNGGSYGPPSKGGSKSGKGGKGEDGGKRKGGGGKVAFISEDAAPIGEFQGTIKSFNIANGYGFIDCPDLKDMYGNDTFLYKKDLGSFEVGEVVTFSAFLNSVGKPQAKGLQGTSGSKRSRNEV